MPGQARDPFLAALPLEPDVQALRQEISEAVALERRRMVVLDDDPTGVQTAHDVDVLTTWDIGSLTTALKGDEPLFYLLTNSRALSRRAAMELAAEIADSLGAAAAALGVELEVISRSDSTLRGHFPWELDSLSRLYGPTGPDGLLIVPAFLEGGRITVDGVHYVAMDEYFIPASETDFAQDPTFGYRHSYLPAWVEEKSEGRWRCAEVLEVPLALLRGGNPDRVAEVLCQARRGCPIVADCASYADLTVLVAAQLRAEAGGYRFLCRTAASFVKVRSASADRPFLTHEDLLPDAVSSGGLVLVGSYVGRTTEQLRLVLEMKGMAARELEVEQLLGGQRDTHLREVTGWADTVLAARRTAVVFTSRMLAGRHGEQDHVAVAASVSAALSHLAGSLTQRPAWLIAKGGITASDVATGGLGVKRARVLGQVAAGVPVWQLGPESCFPGLPYIVFPGNVGTAGSLADIIRLLSGLPVIPG